MSCSSVSFVRISCSPRRICIQSSDHNGTNDDNDDYNERFFTKVEVYSGALTLSHWRE